MLVSGRRSRHFLRIIAFCWRALSRNPFRPLPEWAEALDDRAQKHLATLANPSNRLGFRLFMENLRLEHDLFVEDHASNVNCLALQARVFELAKSFPAAAEICREMSGGISAEILSAILANANSRGISTVRIAPRPIGADSAPSDGRGSDILYISDGEQLLFGTFPTPQDTGVYGLLRRVDAVGYVESKKYLPKTESLPQSLQITFEPGGVLLLL